SHTVVEFVVSINSKADPRLYVFRTGAKMVAACKKNKGSCPQRNACCWYHTNSCCTRAVKPCRAPACSTGEDKSRCRMLHEPSRTRALSLPKPERTRQSKFA